MVPLHRHHPFGEEKMIVDSGVYDFKTGSYDSGVFELDLNEIDKNIDFNGTL